MRVDPVVLGGYVNEYVHELPQSDQAVLEKLRVGCLLLSSRTCLKVCMQARHFQATQEHIDRAAEGLPPKQLTILVTQYDPGTYHDDLQR